MKNLDDNLTDHDTSNPPPAVVPIDIATIVASIVDKKLTKLIKTLAITARKETFQDSSPAQYS